MKNCKWILFFCLSVFTSETFCQNAFNDAVKLRSLIFFDSIKLCPPDDTINCVFTGFRIRDNDFTEALQILRNYTDSIKGISFRNKTNIYSAFDSNPFIQPYLKKGIVDDAGNFLQSAFSSLGNFNITPFADGLAKFLVKRSKEELYVSFFSKLKDSTKFPEFKILFPNTKVLVDNFNSWEYANITNTLREAFDKDFKSLLADIPKLNTLDPATCGKCSDTVIKRIKAIKTFCATDDGRTLLSAFIIGNGFISEEKIPDMIHEIAGPNYLGNLPAANSDIKNAIKLLDILSYSVKSNEYGKSYINKDTFFTAMQDSLTRNIYLGLIYQQLKNESIKIGNDTISNLLASDYRGVQIFVTNILSSSNDIDTVLKNLSSAKKKGETDLTPYWGAIFVSANEFLQKTTNIELIDPRLHFPDKLQNVFNISKQTLEIAHDISVRNYSAVVVGTINFISQHTGKDTLSDFKTFFVKYGSFAANVVEAKNSDDVEKAIESVALPVGSASIKKKTAFNLALNGYLGGFYGNEYLKGSLGKKWAPITGVSAPIGIAASWGIAKGKGGSISAFGSIIDIGAFASYRLTDDTTKTLPEVSLKNILAPGLGVIYGLPWLPLSVGYTYQYGPMLREISSTGKNASDKLNHRWQFFLSVDIPIVNFYTKSR